MNRPYIILPLLLAACSHTSKETPQAAASSTSAPSAPPSSFSGLYYGDDAGPWPERKMKLRGAPLGLTTDPIMSYVELGPSSGETVLLLHGLGSYLRFWEAQLGHLSSKGFRVIALDMLGFGKSDKPEGFAADTPSMAKVIRAFVKNLELEEITLVGHSMGGQVALALAESELAALDKLVLVAPAGLEPFSAAEQQTLRGVVTKESIMAATPDKLEGQIKALNFARWRPELDWLVEDRLAMSSFPDYEAYASAQARSFQGLLDTEPTRSGLARIEVPTLVIYGGADKLIPSGYLHPNLSFDDLLTPLVAETGAKLVKLENCGHLIQLDCPAEVNGALDQFLLE